MLLKNATEEKIQGVKEVKKIRIAAIFAVALVLLSGIAAAEAGAEVNGTIETTNINRSANVAEGAAGYGYYQPAVKMVTADIKAYPGQTINLKVSIANSQLSQALSQALGLRLYVPAYSETTQTQAQMNWKVTATANSCSSYKPNTDECVWFTVVPYATLLNEYLIQVPENTAIGLYSTRAVLINQDGPIGEAWGNIEVSPDIIGYYRSLGAYPDIVEKSDVTQATNDWREELVPNPNIFASPISTEQLLQLANEQSTATTPEPMPTSTPFPIVKITPIIVQVTEDADGAVVGEFDVQNIGQEPIDILSVTISCTYNCTGVSLDNGWVPDESMAGTFSKTIIYPSISLPINSIATLRIKEAADEHVIGQHTALQLTNIKLTDGVNTVTQSVDMPLFRQCESTDGIDCNSSS